MRIIEFGFISRPVIFGLVKHEKALSFVVVDKFQNAVGIEYDTVVNVHFLAHYYVNHFCYFDAEVLEIVVSRREFDKYLREFLQLFGYSKDQFKLRGLVM